LFRPACCRWRRVFPDTEHAGKHADHTADSASEYTTDRSGGFVALFGSLLNALNQPLRMDRGGRAQNCYDNCPERETQSSLRASCRCRADHYLVSMVGLDGEAEQYRGGSLPAGFGHYRFRPE
jgi:hypothetical protein